MLRRKIMPKMCTAIVVALLASGAGQVNKALADDGGLVSNKDLMEQVVLLYEKMSSTEVSVPEGMETGELDKNALKAVVLGYINVDDLTGENAEKTITKQQVMNVLYKTVININDSFAISEDEANEILSECHDNAYLQDENRIAYAFMIKHGIIANKQDSEPNKELTWESCSILIDRIYDMFNNNISFNMGNMPIYIGSHIKDIINEFGEPDRIDQSEYNFDWYVYNNKYNDYFMVGVDNDRICAFFSNSANFSYGDIYPGSEKAALEEELDDGIKLFFNDEDKVDSILYNVREKELMSSEELNLAKMNELLDMINSYRTKNALPAYTIDQVLSIKARENEEEKENIKSGYDVFSVYKQYMIESAENAVGEKSKLNTALGVSTEIDEQGNLQASIYADKRGRTQGLAGYVLAANPSASKLIKMQNAAENVIAENSENDAQSGEDVQADIEMTGEQTKEQKAVEKDIEKSETAEKPSQDSVTPVLAYPENNQVYSQNQDLILELAEEVPGQYHIEIYDIEKDTYAVNEFVNLDSKAYVLPKELFSVGHDYVVTVSMMQEDGSALYSDPVTVSYGDVYDTAVNITAPYHDADTDDDYIGVKWECDLYNDFYIDMYNEETGELVASTLVENGHEALIQNVDPGKYYLYVTALRKGDIEFEKAQDSVHFEVKLSEPVIKETILAPEDIYNFVYEDKVLGVLYFYDEEYVRVDKDGNEIKEEEKTDDAETENAAQSTPTPLQDITDGETQADGDTAGEGELRRKIIQKQVKATKGYRELFEYQSKRESISGDLVKDPVPLIKYNPFPTLINNENNTSEMGMRILNEASKYLGVPYVWGGTTPNGFDCSGLVQYVCNSLGISVNRVAEDQAKNGIEIPRDQMQPGDLLFFKDSTGYIHHVAIYAGNNEMLHAPYTGTVVKIQSMTGTKYESELCNIRRVY